MRTCAYGTVNLKAIQQEGSTELINVIKLALYLKTSNSRPSVCPSFSPEALK